MDDVGKTVFVQAGIDVCDCDGCLFRLDDTPLLLSDFCKCSLNIWLLCARCKYKKNMINCSLFDFCFYLQVLKNMVTV